MATVDVTMLNSMADRDFETALDRQVVWGLKVLDLKDAVFGKSVADLTVEQAEQAAGMIQERGLSVFCLSTNLFDAAFEVGEEAFRQAHLDPVDRVIEVAKIFNPNLIRLIAAKTVKVETGRMAYLLEAHPWLMGCYREAIGRLSEAGFGVTIENECRDCIFETAEDIVQFFEILNCGDAVNFTWDVQNLWQMGTFPTMEIYTRLKPLIRYYHLKGGQHSDGDMELRWKSSLADASWPVVEITKQVVSDGISPVICLNGSHGERKPDYDYGRVLESDLAFARKVIAEGKA